MPFGFCQKNSGRLRDTGVPIFAKKHSLVIIVHSKNSDIANPILKKRIIECDMRGHCFFENWYYFLQRTSKPCFTNAALDIVVKTKRKIYSPATSRKVRNPRIKSDVFFQSDIFILRLSRFLKTLF
jgi:hypothetical protein